MQETWNGIQVAEEAVVPTSESVFPYKHPELKVSWMNKAALVLVRVWLNMEILPAVPGRLQTETALGDWSHAEMLDSFLKSYGVRLACGIRLYLDLD